jgi:hypothetical protein
VNSREPLDRPTVGCSVVTCGYLPYARVLAESFREHNPEAEFAVLLVDDPDEQVGPDEPFTVLRPAEIGVLPGELNLRGLMYTPTELVCSLRPALLRHLLRRGASSAILMDADGLVCGDLQPIARLACKHGTVFTPHLLSPHPPPQGEDSLELVQIRYGVMNGGLLAVGPASTTFLDWLDARLARHCVNSPEHGLYLDQRWLDLAVGLFPSHVLKDLGSNVMCLNLHDRDVVWDGDRPAMPGAPLRYFHFLLGFDPEHPEHLCDERFAHRWLPYLDDRPGATRLAREYARRLLAHDAVRTRRRPQHFDVLPHGGAVDRHMRAAYRHGVIDAELAGAPLPPNPFDDGDSDALLRWLAEPCGDRYEDAGLSRYNRAIRDIRPDLVAAFPLVPGEHTQRFLDWVDSELDGAWMREYATGSLAAARIAGALRVDRRMREMYREELARAAEAQTSAPPSPYSSESASAFLAWLREPQHGASPGCGVSRYLLRVRSERAELLDAFADVPGRDTAAYLAWVTAEAAQPGVDVPPELTP